MDQLTNAPEWEKARILRRLDEKLSKLTCEQQNLAAAYARGIYDGLKLQAAVQTVKKTRRHG